jgi:hypothetical protein
MPSCAEIRQHKPLSPVTRLATALSCTPFPPKHFRIINRLSEYGFFRAGAVLIGTHAFLAMGNMPGVRWLDGAETVRETFAHAGHNISVALPASFKLNVHRACRAGAPMVLWSLIPCTPFALPHPTNGLITERQTRRDAAASLAAAASLICNQGTLAPREGPTMSTSIATTQRTTESAALLGFALITATTAPHSLQVQPSLGRPARQSNGENRKLH